MSAPPRAELATARLLLRPFRPADVDDALAYRDDPEFARHLPHIPQPFTRAHAEAFVARNMSDPWETSPTFAVVLANRVIGTVNLEIEPAQQLAMIGFAIARAHWGVGIGFEAAHAVADWAFAVHGLAKLWAATEGGNARSQRLLLRLGMREEGRLRSHGLGREGRVDSVRYGVLRAEWCAKA